MRGRTKWQVAFLLVLAWAVLPGCPNTGVDPDNGGESPPGPLLSGFAPALSFAREGYSDSPTISDPPTVTLREAQPVAVQVTISSDDPGVTSTDVTILAGSLTGLVTVNAITASANAYTLTASYHGTDLTAQVRVLDATEIPAVESLLPAMSTTQPDTPAPLTVKLDLPSPAGGTVVDLRVTGEGSVPSTVTVPDDAQSAAFDYTPPANATIAAVTASSGGSDAEAVVTVTD